MLYWIFLLFTHLYIGLTVILATNVCTVLGALVYGWGISRWLKLCYFNYGWVMFLNRTITIVVIFASFTITALSLISMLFSSNFEELGIYYYIIQFFGLYYSLTLIFQTENLSEEIIMKT